LTEGNQTSQTAGNVNVIQDVPIHR
jgi:hypothetical protein